MFQDAGTVTYRFLESPAKLDANGKVYVKVQLPNGQIAEGEIEEGSAEEMVLRAARELPRRSVLFGFGNVSVPAEQARAADEAHYAAVVAANQAAPAATTPTLVVHADGTVAGGTQTPTPAPEQAPASAPEKAAKGK